MPLKLKFWIWFSAIYVMGGFALIIELVRFEKYTEAVLSAGLLISFDRTLNALPYLKKVSEEIRKFGE